MRTDFRLSFVSEKELDENLIFFNICKLCTYLSHKRTTYALFTSVMFCLFLSRKNSNVCLYESCTTPFFYFAIRATALIISLRFSSVLSTTNSPLKNLSTKRLAFSSVEVIPISDKVVGRFIRRSRSIIA